MRDAPGEEFKQFCMGLEFLVRRPPPWREIAEGILLREGDIVEQGEEAEEQAVEGATARRAPVTGSASLGIVERGLHLTLYRFSPHDYKEVVGKQSRSMMPARCHVLNFIGGRALLPDLLVAVLGAGASRRLGRAKQLVPVGGEPLLRRQCRCALSARVGEVVAILGCDDAQHREVIADLPVDVRVNDEWAEGLAATLRSAVRAAKERQAALLVLPCDQYRIVPDDLRRLYNHWRWAPSIACVSRWGGYAGPPAILPIHYYDDVLRLRGDIGARSLLYDLHRPCPDEIPNPRAAFDLDSPEEMRIANEWTACQV